MNSLSFFYKGLELFLACILTLLVSISDSDSQIINDLFDSSDFSVEVANVMKEELQLLNMKLTKSFIANHVRKKRSSHPYHLTLTQSNDQSSEISLGQTPLYGWPLFLLHDHPYIISSHGTYQLEGLEYEDLSEYNHPQMHTFKTYNNSFHIPTGELILSTIYWRNTHFLLVTSRHRSFSQLYTTYNSRFDPVLRQQIRNNGQATAGEFFIHRGHLFMIIACDNEMHSLTLTPIFLWMGTYMDEIHNLQTRGANAVTAMNIGSDTYIAVAQAKDTAGNPEVGTLVVRMYEYEKIEKLQLLWSNYPVALTHLRYLAEHFFIIGQENEPAIIYWFGGHDFVYWEKLDDLKGEYIYFDSIYQRKDEVVLMGATEKFIKFYTISSSAQKTTSLVPLKTHFDYVVPTDKKIAGAKFVTRSPVHSDGNENEERNYYIIVHEVDEYESSCLRILRIYFTRTEIAASRTKDEEDDSLTICMEAVGELLDESEKYLQPLNDLSKLVLTKNGNWTYPGKLYTSSKIAMDVENTVANFANVKPEGITTEYNELPHQLLHSTEHLYNLFHTSLEINLLNLVRKSIPNTITGDLYFNDLHVNMLNAHGTNLQVDILNSIPTEVFRNQILRKEPKHPQIVTGEWWIANFSVNTFVTHSNIGNKFLRLTCLNGEKEIIESRYHFTNVILSEDLKLGANSRINDVLFSSIVFSHSQHDCIVHGYKKSKNILTKSNFHHEYMNGVSRFPYCHFEIITSGWLLGKSSSKSHPLAIIFSKWANETIRLSGPPQHVFGRKVFQADVAVKYLEVENVNNIPWDEFIHSVLLNNQHEIQVIEGDLDCESASIKEASVKTINRVNIQDLMTTGGNQHIQSHIKARHLNIGDQRVDSINGHTFSNYVLRNENTDILGPVVLENVNATNVHTKHDVKIGNQVISHIATLRKRLIIAGYNKILPVRVLGPIKTDFLRTKAINGISLRDIPEAFWSSYGNNVIPGSLYLKGREVTILRNFETNRLNNFRMPEDFVIIDAHNETIYSPVNFKQNVVVQREVTMKENALLNNFKLPQFYMDIVRLGNEKKIVDHKVCAESCHASYGLDLKKINGFDFTKDVVLLNGPNYRFYAKKEFDVMQVTNLTADTNIDVSGHVNNYKLQDLVNNTAVQYYGNRPIEIWSNVRFTQPFQASFLSVKGHINDKDFDAYVKKTVFLNRSSNLTDVVIPHGSVIFESDSDVKNINSIPVHQYLSQVTQTDSPTFIKGHKTFTNVECDNLLCASINSINLKALRESGLSKTANQNITSAWVLSNTYAENIETQDIGGIQVSNFVRSNSPIPAAINSDVMFTASSTKSLKNTFVKGKINGYDISKILSKLQSINSSREFDVVHVLGNLNWRQPSRSNNSLSYLSNNSMNTKMPQTVKGPTHFKNGLNFKHVNSTQWIGGIDLKKIKEDSNWGVNQIEFSGKNIFRGGLLVDHSGMETKYAQFRTINNNDFKNFVQNLILYSRPNSNIISGIKKFNAPIQVENLVSGESMFREMVLINNTKPIQSANFYDVQAQNLYPPKIFINDLNHLLKNRVMLNGNQNLTGNYIFNNLEIDECHIKSINNIQSTDLLYTNSSQPQYIYTENTVQSLTVKGDMHASRMNNRNLHDLYSNTYHKNQTQKLYRPVVFKKQVVMRDNLQVDKHAHYDKIHYIVQSYLKHLQKAIKNVPASDAIKNFVKNKISSLVQNATSTVWLKYLRLQQELSPFSARSRVETFIGKTKVLISLYGQLEGRLVGLPQGCYCKVVDFLQSQNGISATKFDRVECANVFVLQGTESVYSVHSYAVSYNDSCIKPNDRKAQLRILDRDLTTKLSSESEHEAITGLDSGYLIDGKIFSIDGSDYIVLAQYYNSYERTHNVPTLVYSLSKGKILLIQSIPSFGARRIAISSVDGNIILSIANSYNSDLNSCETHSSIYFWSRQQKQFLLMRDAKTIGAIDTVFVSIPSDKGKQEEFVAFALNDKSRVSDDVDIYQYDYQTKNFLIFQTIHTDWEVESLQVVSIREIHYLIIVTQNYGLMFYEYSFIEGFRHSFSVPITGSTDVSPFVWKSRLQFAITTKTTSLLAEGVLSSRLV